MHHPDPDIKTQHYQRVDLALRRHGHAGLAALVQELRAQDPPAGWQAITRQIFLLTDGELDVSERTIRSWFVEGRPAA